jgi:type III secretory pathway component EscT
MLCEILTHVILLYILVLPMGIEPTSMRFRDACITTMLRKQFQQIVYLLFYSSGNIETHLDHLLGSRLLIVNCCCTQSKNYGMLGWSLI